MKVIEKEDIKDIFKQRDENSHKGMFGKVGIIGGSMKYLGAIKLANISATAMTSGAGIVRVIVPEKIAFGVLPYLLEETLYPVPCDDEYKMLDSNMLKEAIDGLAAIGIGMGWDKSESYLKILEYIFLNYSGKVLIDADGLNILSNMNLDILKNAKCKIVLTPHIKEFERLTKIPVSEILENKEKIAKEFALKYNVILLLKGHETIITDGKNVNIVKRGCAGMATAGSGDTLSGIITGMLGYNDLNITTISACAYLAGVAGELAQEKYTDISMKASDTSKFIPDAIKYIRS